MGAGSPRDAASRPERQRRRSWLVGMVALAALVGAGWSLFYQLKDIKALKNIWPFKAAVTEPDEQAIKSLLVLRPAAPAPPGSTPRPGVVLERAEEPRVPLVYQSRAQGILTREIVRQAFLIAARDGLGLTTRDGTLGESFATGSGGTPLEIASSFVGRYLVRVIIRRRNGEDRKVLWTQDLVLPSDDATVYPNLVERAEALARDQFLKVFKQAGVRGGKPNLVQPGAGVPGAAEKSLAQMTFTTQFAAVRQIHAAIRTDGESPALLGALVRGYANLGILTEFHWNASHKVFKARALLYAQRMAARDPRSPWALWHRAYAQALAGFHQLALADLDAAKRLEAGAAPARPRRPAWVDLIDAYCRYDPDRLAASTDPEQAQLASLLRFLTVADPSTPGRTLETAREVLGTNPECYLVHDAMCQVRGVANLHVATLLGPKVLAATLSQRLLAMPGLPPAAAALIRQEKAESEVARALVQAGKSDADSGELSWTVLGRMIQEIQFTEVWRRVDFMRNQWSVPVDDFLAGTRPLVAEHPYRAFIESYGVDRGSEPQTYIALLQSVEPVDIELTELPFLRLVQTVDEDRSRRLHMRALWHNDHVAEDFAATILDCDDPGDKALNAHWLLAVSPDSPLAMATLVESDWASAQAQAADWEHRSGHQPMVLGALGRQYTRLRRWADAERCLKQYIHLSPDKWAYEMLAETYRARGQIDRWKETLEEVLKQEDTGLDHAMVRVELARYYMGRKEWAKAQPYAEAAAQSWAGWAMQCAVECYDGMGDWDRAELWVRRLSERYPSSQLAWFHWCIRTGHGDARPAAKLALPYYAGLGDAIADPDLDLLVVCSILAQEPRPALEALRKAYPRPGHGLEGLFLALLADEAGETALRDQTWKAIHTDDANVRQLAALLARSMAEGRGGKLDLPAVDALIAAAQGPRRGDLCYFVGRFLDLRGRATEGLRYLDRCATSPQTKPMTRMLAVSALRDHRAESGKGEAKLKT